MKAIFNRRSVRNYLPKPVSKEDLEQLLRAGMRAPSAGNQQAWEFMVLQEQKDLLALSEIHPYAKMLKEATCAIVVCGNLERSKFDNEFWVQDCSAATQNILLEAYHLGLGTCWCGVYSAEDREKGVHDYLELPQHIIPLSLIAVGHPVSVPEPMDTFRPERIHYGKWKNQK